MLYQKAIQRNVTLLRSARNNLTYAEVCAVLDARHMKPVEAEAWTLWCDFYASLATDNPLYEKEIIYNDRSLSWFARDLKKRYEKTIIS